MFVSQMLISMETGVEKLTETGRCNDGSQAADSGTHTNTMARSHWSELESLAETQSVIGEAPQGSLG